MNTDRLKNEQDFHDNRFKGTDPRDKVGKYYSANKHLDERYIEIVSSHCMGKKLLEYGCGSGQGSRRWMELDAEVTGIDISPEGIKAAQESIADTGYKAEFYVMNAEDMKFDDDKFDIITGTAIIHHLDLSNSYKELCRVLKKDGRVVLCEPLGQNPFINLYRALTPHLRTRDEHPLVAKDIELLKEYFYSVETEFFTLFTLFVVPFRNLFFYDTLCGLLRKLDEVIFRIPVMRNFAWFALIHASNPKK
jgi:ubiquinone/menaquinone biosynthesis C-methylase UbiE